MLTIDIEQENDGRWLGELTALPSVMAYGAPVEEARQKAAALAFRVIADRLEHGEPVPDEVRSLFALV
jgi:predicted RNase H-like HicB family nuclease